MNENKMKAVVRSKSGSADVLQLTEVKKPVPRDNELLINIKASAVTKGTIAIQYAKYLGAKVTGVCSGKNIDLIKLNRSEQIM